MSANRPVPPPTPQQLDGIRLRLEVALAHLESELRILAAVREDLNRLTQGPPG